MHMNRRGHAGREGRLQILGTEDAWAGLNRERTDVGQRRPLARSRPSPSPIRIVANGDPLALG